MQTKWLYTVILFAYTHFFPTEQQPHPPDFNTQWIFLTNYIGGFDEMLWQCWMLQISLFTFSVCLLICTCSPPQPSHGCNVLGPITTLYWLLCHFLILPLNGCSDTVSRPQIYAFGVSHCLAFPSSSHHMPPSSLSLALILYFWDSICTAWTDGRVIFTVSLSDTHIHTIHMSFNTAQTFKCTLEMKYSKIKLWKVNM